MAATKYERQQQILEILNNKECKTYSFIAEYIGVSYSTIKRDILDLTCSHHIEVVRGQYGGVRLIGHKNERHFTYKQKELLNRLSMYIVTDEDFITMHSIISDTY